MVGGGQKDDKDRKDRKKHDAKVWVPIAEHLFHQTDLNASPGIVPVAADTCIFLSFLTRGGIRSVAARMPLLPRGGAAAP